MHGVSAESKSRPPDRAADHWTHAAAGSQPASQGPGDNGHIQPAVTLITASLMPSLMDCIQQTTRGLTSTMPPSLSIMVSVSSLEPPGASRALPALLAAPEHISASSAPLVMGALVSCGGGGSSGSQSQQCGSEP
jgi:hypothetical protein